MYLMQVQVDAVTAVAELMHKTKSTGHKAVFHKLQARLKLDIH